MDFGRRELLSSRRYSKLYPGRACPAGVLCVNRADWVAYANFCKGLIRTLPCFEEPSTSTAQEYGNESPMGAKSTRHLQAENHRTSSHGIGRFAGLSAAYYLFSRTGTGVLATAGQVDAGRFLFKTTTVSWCRDHPGGIQSSPLRSLVVRIV